MGQSYESIPTITKVWYLLSISEKYFQFTSLELHKQEFLSEPKSIFFLGPHYMYM